MHTKRLGCGPLVLAGVVLTLEFSFRRVAGHGISKSVSGEIFGEIVSAVDEDLDFINKDKQSVA